MSQSVELELRLQRERDGRCGDCGIDTHETVVIGNDRIIRKGLTIKDEVHRGRCLFCHPFCEHFRTDSSQAAAAYAPLGASAQRSIHHEAEMNADYDTRGPGRDGSDSFPAKNSVTGGIGKSGNEAGADGYKSLQKPRRNPQNEKTVERSKELDGLSEIKIDNAKKRKIANCSNNTTSTVKKKIKSSGSKEDFVGGILAEAKTKPENGKVQDKCMEKLRIAVEKEDEEEGKRKWIRAIKNCDGLEVALNAIKAHPGKSSVQYEGCKLIASLAWSGYDTEISSSGGIAVILRTLKSMPSSKVAEAGLEVLTNLSTKHDLREKIIAGNGICIATTALKKSQRNAQLQAQGCKLFVNLVSDESVKTALRISRAGAIPLIINAMKRHQKHDEIIEEGCGALRNLSISTEVRTVIAECGGIDLVFELIDNEAEQFLEEVLDLLRNLTTDNSDIQAEVSQKGGVLHVLKLMEEFARNDGLLEKACRVLLNLASHNEGFNKILKHEGIVNVADAMRNNEESEKIAEEACHFLSKISTRPAGKKMLQKEEVLDALRRAAETFPAACAESVEKIFKLMQLRK